MVFACLIIEIGFVLFLFIYFLGFDYYVKLYNYFLKLYINLENEHFNWNLGEYNNKIILKGFSQLIIRGIVSIIICSQ